MSALYPHFVGIALSLGLADFDAAALKDARPRHLTQAVAAWLYETTTVDGVAFSSRHGDDLHLWAIFERPGDPAISPKINPAGIIDLHHNAEAIQEAFGILRLKWRDE